MTRGVESLKQHRDGAGGWRRFPYYYTLLGLSEIRGTKGVEEMRYAASGLERMLKRRGGGDRFAIRRRAVAERVLARV